MRRIITCEEDFANRKISILFYSRVLYLRGFSYTIRLMKRDHTKLICDIGELSAACHSSSCLENFLQRTAELTAEHMSSDVCSIYLYFDETQELVLEATKGLKPEAIGQVRLKLGEGLTGLAVKELRPICERQASKKPGYRYFPDIGEEQYDSFLAVPILRGQNRIGAIVVQNTQSNYFDQDDINALRAISSQLANTIETVKVLISIDTQQPEVPVQEDSSSLVDVKFLKGRTGAPGIVYGPVAVMEGRHQYFLCADCLEDEHHYTLDDFLAAVDRTEKELRRLQSQVEEKLADVASLIFTAQILMLKDKFFMDAIVRLIKNDVNPPLAIKQTVHDYVHKFQNLDNAYLQEKAQDVQDVGIRLLEHLVGEFAQSRDLTERVVIARELFPSDILKLSTLNVKGLVVLSGGITSHIAILARSLEIPLVLLDDSRLLKLSRQQQILIDADNANVYIDPEQDVINSFQKKHAEKDFELLSKLTKPATHTKDGTRIVLQANINLLCDLKTARGFKAEGIGLYRTEFPFIVRSDFPSEEEQFLIYQKLFQGMPGKEIIFRTLDIGGDKVLSYYDYGKEENPFLGMRSIRFSLRHKEIFRQQLRAILRAGAEATSGLKIMFPMISSLDEFLEAKQEVLICIDELTNQEILCHQSPKIGTMIELPAVVEIISEMAQEADFFSIGTNDFIQYMLAVDRTNEKVADLYLPHHPSVLRALKKIVDAAIAHQIEVSVCGDMSYDQRYLPYFLGIGLRKFSVDPHLIPGLQQVIETIDLKQAEAEAALLLQEKTVLGLERRIFS